MMTPEIAGNILMYTILFIIVFIVARSLLKKNKLEDSNIDLEDLLIGEDGRMSKTACVLFGSFLLTSWMMIYLTASGKMTEGYLAIYVGAWITPSVTKIIVGQSQSK